jgi:hypothetical protein
MMSMSEADNDESSSSAIRSRLASKDAQDIIREDIYHQLQEISKSNDNICSPIAHEGTGADKPNESSSRIYLKSPSSSSRADHSKDFPDYLNMYLDSVEPSIYASKTRPGVENERDDVPHAGLPLPLSRVSSLSEAGEDWNSRGATQGEGEEEDDIDNISGLESSHISGKSLRYVDEKAVKTISKIKPVSDHFLENSSLLHKYDLPGARVPGTGVELKAWPWQLEKDIAYERVTGVKLCSPSTPKRQAQPGSIDTSRSRESCESREGWLDAVDLKRRVSPGMIPQSHEKQKILQTNSPGGKTTKQDKPHPSPDRTTPGSPSSRVRPPLSFSPAKYYSSSPSAGPAVSSPTPAAEVYSGAALRRPDGSADEELWSAQGQFDEIHNAYISALKERDEHMLSRWKRLNANLTNTKV